MVPVAATRTPDAATLHHHVFQIPAGGDVAHTIAAFARGCRNFGLCVLSASGPVAAAVLWEASPVPSTLTFTGRFDLLSMTATFLPGGGRGSLAVTLAGPQGQVVGGVVAGPVLAAATVTVVAATYSSPAFRCVDAVNNTSASMLPVMGGSSLLGQGGGEKNYFNGVERYLDLVEENGEEKEVERNRLEYYVKQFEQCLVSPAAAGAASAGGAGEKRGIDDASLLGGSNVGNTFEQYPDLAAAADRAFGCGQHLAFGGLRASSGACAPLYRSSAGEIRTP